MNKNTMINLNLKKHIINSLLLAIGLILKELAPPLLFGMKPDLLLVIMFIIILINKDYKTTLLTGIICGIITGASTTFPGGQIPNFIDKIVSSHIIYFLLIPIINKLNNQIKVILCSSLGTLISGFTFLLSTSFLVGLPGSTSFSVLFLTVVIPTAIVNTIASIIFFNALKVALTHSNTNIFE